MSTTWLDDAESGGRECLLPVIYGLFTLSISTLGNGAKIRPWLLKGTSLFQGLLHLDCSGLIGVALLSQRSRSRFASLSGECVSLRPRFGAD